MISFSTNCSINVKTHTSRVLGSQVMTKSLHHICCVTHNEALEEEALTLWSLVSLRCTPASSVLKSSGRRRSWTITIEKRMLGKGQFTVAYVELQEEPVLDRQEGTQGYCVQQDFVKPFVSAMAVAYNSYPNRTLKIILQKFIDTEGT